MKTRVKYPIRLKVLLITLGFVALSALAYLGFAVKTFREDKLSLIYEMNTSTVKTLTSRLKTELESAREKAHLLSLLSQYPERSPKNSASLHSLLALLQSDPNWVSFTLIEKQKKGWKVHTHYSNPAYFELYGVKPKSFDEIAADLPLHPIQAFGAFAFNSSPLTGLPTLTLGYTLSGASTGQIALLDLRLDRLIDLIPKSGIAQLFVINREGQLIAHPEPKKILQAERATDHPIVHEALDSDLPFQMKPFEWKGEKWIGAFSSVGIGGLFVVSEIPFSEVDRASFYLVTKTIFIALFILTLAYLVTGWLSRSLTRPLSHLVEATEKISAWDFSQQVAIQTQDEVATLATAFNSMASDLQAQRKQLDRHREELEIKVQQRTSELQREKEKVSQVQESLVRTTRLASLGEMAGITAHEVLNPANNIHIRVEKMKKDLQSGAKEDYTLLSTIVKGWEEAYQKNGFESLKEDLSQKSETGDSTLLQEDLENLAALSRDALKRQEALEEDLHFVTEGISRITRIVNNMRSLARVKGTKEKMDAHRPLEDAIAALSDQFQKNKITLFKEFSSDPRTEFTIEADSDELVQVFSNIMRNALHAIRSAERREGEFRIRTAQTADRIEIRFIDNGTGIAEEHLGRIFEPDFTTKSSEEGTGLGLSIARRLVRAFDGDVEVEDSSPSKGTTFLIWFPKAEALR